MADYARISPSFRIEGEMVSMGGRLNEEILRVSKENVRLRQSHAAELDTKITELTGDKTKLEADMAALEAANAALSAQVKQSGESESGQSSRVALLNAEIAQLKTGHTGELEVLKQAADQRDLDAAAGLERLGKEAEKRGQEHAAETTKARKAHATELDGLTKATAKLKQAQAAETARLKKAHGEAVERLAKETAKLGEGHAAEVAKLKKAHGVQ